MDDTLALASPSRAWSLLIRHAERPAIPPGTFGTDLSITADGLVAAHGLGRCMHDRLGRVVSSPIRRCVQTADAIIGGAGRAPSVSTSTALGDPGVWIADAEVAGDAFMRFGAEGVVARQLQGPLRGFVRNAHAARGLLDLLLPPRTATPGQIDVFVSHDAVIAPLLGLLLGTTEVRDVWPRYLEGCFLSRSATGLDLLWRGRRHSIRAPWPEA